MCQPADPVMDHVVVGPTIYYHAHKTCKTIPPWTAAYAGTAVYGKWGEIVWPAGLKIGFLLHPG